MIIVRGASEHNLKGVDVEIPRGALACITGVSGSGKSSLAFDTIYREGQRRFLESLSSYARQFLGQMEKPLYDTIRGLSPTISVDQKSSSHNPRSTVGTITEIYDYLRVLFARIGKLSCHRCGRPVARQTPQQIVEELSRLPEGTRFSILAPLVRDRKGEHKALLEKARRAGFSRVRVDGEVRSLEEDIDLDKKKKHDIEIVLDRLVAKGELTESARSRLTDSVEAALREGSGSLIVEREGASDLLFSEEQACQHCGISFPELTPQLFSFNSPLGMCPECHGLGTRAEMDEELMVPDPSLSINQGAVKPWGVIEDKGGWRAAVVRSMARHFGIDLAEPWHRLSSVQRRVVLHGDADRITIRKGKRSFKTRFEGLVPILMRRMKETDSEMVQKYYARYMSDKPCSACAGVRLRPEALAVTVGGKTIAALAQSSIDEAHLFATTVALEGTDALIGSELLKEIVNRLRFLRDVGLGYLSLDRLAPTLSGGEAQRIRLASQIGSELTGVVYILDEPSIGLHPRDNGRLLAALRHLRDMGNTVVVVEHDRETIEAADHIVDFGPGAGVHGGEIVAAGPAREIALSSQSITGKYLSGELSIPISPERRKPRKEKLEIRGARENNLKNLDVTIPLGVLVGVAGVSGAGKSTLVNEILYPALARTLNRAEGHPGDHDSVLGIENLDKVIDIDQSPIGRTPRSNPATYTKAFDEIRG
ncbi:MAG TPA: excinuclease ABC subunit UvrA, partial [Vicinamibacteria bacterium]|nr:excinuclease ABC subunit UvrA [Vicinamibacteria bacterium]